MTTSPFTYDFNLERKALNDDGETLTISGVASNWDLDRQGDRMSPTAFARSLSRYMATNPILLYAHKVSMPMGRVVDARVTSDGLFVRAELPKPEPGTPEMQVWKMVRAGVIKAFSVGGKGTRRIVNGVLTVTEWDLREISIAPLGVNGSTLFSVQMGKCLADADDDERRRLLLLTAELAATRARLSAEQALTLRAARC